MIAIQNHLTGRRAILGGALASAGLLALQGCASWRPFSLEAAVQRLLFLSTQRAFDRMLQSGGFWDQQVAMLNLSNALGVRGDILSRILTSGLFKDRFDRALGDIAFRGAERAAPVVADAVRIIGFDNARALLQGGPTAATAFLHQRLGTRLIDAMVPELGDAFRIARDPLIGQLLSAAAGTDVPRIVDRFAYAVDSIIWREIGNEEAAIRTDPKATGDPLIIGALGHGARY